MVNEVLVQDGEVAVQDGAVIRIGPLDFRLKVEKTAVIADGTPLPGGSAETAALAAVKATAAAQTPKTPARDTTPNPARLAKPGGPLPQPITKPADKPTPAPAASAPAAPEAAAAPAATAAQPGDPKEAVKPGSQEAPSLTSSETVTDEDHDRIAAMLLGMDENGNSNVPDGSTVMDIPSPLAGDTGTAETSKAGDSKQGNKKPTQSREEMSTAANDLLRKYMRRPK
jgi:hypothetical protein